MAKITSAPSRIWFMPVGSEVLGTDGGQLWYATEDGTGSVSDFSKSIVPGSFKFVSESDDETS